MYLPVRNQLKTISSITYIRRKPWINQIIDLLIEKYLDGHLRGRIQLQLKIKSGLAKIHKNYKNIEDAKTMQEKTAHLAKEFVGGADENQFFPPRGKKTVFIKLFPVPSKWIRSRIRNVLWNFQDIFWIV
jgi:hypothetical protein